MYQFTVYSGYKEEYICYCTPECAKAIDNYLQYRERCGEILTEKSPLFREQFDITDLEQIRKKAKNITINAIVMSLKKRLHLAGITEIEQLKEGEHSSAKRKKIMRTHGFRKFVNTTMVNARINDTIRNMLLGHTTEYDGAYYKPKSNDLLEEYIKVIDALTINEENRLKRQLETLKANKSEIEQLKEEFELLKKATREHINQQVKESVSLEGVKLSDALMELVYKEEKEGLARSVERFRKEHPEYFDKQ